MTNKLNIVLIGNGMYSTGQGTDGYGTIVPAINEFNRKKEKVNLLHIVGSRAESTSKAKEKTDKLQTISGCNLPIVLSPNSEDNPEEYKKAILEIEKPACAIIAVPDHLHYEITKFCLENNIHCLVVKPFTVNLEEAHELTSIANAKGLMSWVEFHKRWDIANVALRDSYLSGEIGELLYCIVEYSQRKSIPTKNFKEWSSKTNILNYLGVHYIDLMRFITEAVPKRVSAMGQDYYLNGVGVNTYDAIQCSIEWENVNNKTFIQTIFTNWVDPDTSTSASDQKIKLIGTNGRFESDQKNRGLYLNVDTKSPKSINPYFCSSYKNSRGLLQWSGYGIDSIIDFLDSASSLISGRIKLEDIPKSKPSFNESIYSTSVLQAAQKSLNSESAWIEL